MVARSIDAILDGHNARSTEKMRSEFGEAVSRQGTQRDELIDASLRLNWPGA